MFSTTLPACYSLPPLFFSLMLTQFLFLLSTIFFFVSPLLSPAINSPLCPAFFLLFSTLSFLFFVSALFSSLSLIFPSHSLSFSPPPPPLTFLVPQLHRLSNKRTHTPFNRTPSFIFHLCQSPWSCLRESNPPADSSFLFFLFPL